MGSESPFTIMCFTWNAAGLKLCETMSRVKADDVRKGFKAIVTMKQRCMIPDFFEEIRGTIKGRNPSLVVITTQDEDSSGTYFHSDLLISSMPEINYFLIKRDKLEDVGEVASGLSQGTVSTGKPYGSAIRISIYARNDLLGALRVGDNQIKNFFGNNGQDEITCVHGKQHGGAIASYVWHDVYGKFAFITTHLPSGVEALKIGKDIDYPTYRAASRSANLLCLLKILNKLETSLPPESKPDHIFLLGDLNYDIVVPGQKSSDIIATLSSNISISKLRELQQYDELKQALKEIPLIGFKEGPAAEGPLFLPTWKMARDRPDSCVPTSDSTTISPTCFADASDQTSGIGWHDRILYRESCTSSYMTHCTSYDRIDIKNMHASTHAGVVAFFDMRASTGC